MALTQAEARVAQLLDAGYAPSTIAERSGIGQCVVERLVNWSSTAGDAAREEAIRQGSRDLLTAIERARRAG